MSAGRRKSHWRHPHCPAVLLHLIGKLSLLFLCPENHILIMLSVVNVVVSTTLHIYSTLVSTRDYVLGSFWIAQTCLDTTKGYRGSSHKGDTRELYMCSVVETTTITTVTLIDSSLSSSSSDSLCCPKGTRGNSHKWYEEALCVQCGRDDHMHYTQ